MCRCNGYKIMDNVFERYREPFEERPIEIHFPLDERDILRLLKGIEYNQIVTFGALENKPQRIHIRVFSPDRVKHISWEKWRKFVFLCMQYPELIHTIEEMEKENE